MSGRSAVLLFVLATVCAAVSQLWLDGRQQARCAYDGARVQSPYAVAWSGASEGPGRQFCTIECALRWRRQRQREGPADPGRYVVHDEVTGEPLAAELAFYVRTPHWPAGRNHNFTRAFKRWQDALERLRALEGESVSNPFGAVSGAEAK